jgi:hypothetical protein
MSRLRRMSEHEANFDGLQPEGTVNKGLFVVVPLRERAVVFFRLTSVSTSCWSRS